MDGGEAQQTEQEETEQSQVDAKNTHIVKVKRELEEKGDRAKNRDTWKMIFRGVLFPLFDDLYLHLYQCLHYSMQITPPFPSSKTPQAPSEKQIEAASSENSCWSGLTHLVELVDKQFSVLDFILNEVMTLLISCIDEQPESVARKGVEELKSLLQRIGKRCENEHWTLIAVHLTELFVKSTPTALVPGYEGHDRSGHNDMKETDETELPMALPFDPQQVVTKCIVQLLLIDLLQEVVPCHSDVVPASSVVLLLDAIQQSFEFAHYFNQQIGLRQRLKKLGLMQDMRHLPGLLKQERDGLAAFLSITVALIKLDPVNAADEGEASQDKKINKLTQAAEAKDKANEDSKVILSVRRTSVTQDANLCERFFSVSRWVVQRYLQREQQLRSQGALVGAVPPDGPKTFVHLAQIERERDIAGLTPIVCNQILQGLLKLPTNIMRKNQNWIYSLLVDLITVESKDVHQLVRHLFIGRIASLLGVEFIASPPPGVRPTYTSLR